MQKADGLCHPLLKLSLLNFVKLRLESEVQFGEDGFSIFAAFFTFEIKVVNYCNNVFSKCYACANIPAFITLIKYISSFYQMTSIAFAFIISPYKTIGGRSKISIS